ncbi:MAG: SRPBCC family protein [Candidatus Eremiobacteraeota bacterium]|nr:SRPBCC family protein [Candidatus Eremiobacteraeota bacterium]
MTIEDAFDIDAPLDRVWPVLNDVPRVATCIPNAEITEIVDATTYRAKVSVKVGPVNVGYNATIKVVSIDEATHTATIDITGNESKGRGGMRAQVTSHAEAVDGRTHVTLQTQAQISGVVATVGGRLIESVARKTVADFAKKLTALV